MTATWMLASTLVALLFTMAAVALTRVASLYRGVPLRWFWVVASVASLSMSLLWLRPAAPEIRVASPNELPGTVSGSRALDVSAALQSPRPAPQQLPTLTIPRVPQSWQPAMLALWGCASLTMLVLLSIATVRLLAERRRWTLGTVADTPVLISKTFGPAIVGVHHPAIVLPEWVLELDETAQRAIVAHEAAHRAARDPLLLILGLAVVVVMPWNIGLWMSWRGLRRAIELDCDARVTAHGIDAPEYARVLLGAWRRAHESWLPSTAFAERASGLGARVEHLMRPEPRGRAMRTLSGSLMAAGLVFVACSAPAPKTTTLSLDKAYPLVFIDGVKRTDIPPRFRFVGPVVAETTTTPTFSIRYTGKREYDSVAARQYPSEDSVTTQVIDAPTSIKHFGEEARYGAVLYYTHKYLSEGGKVLAPGEGSMGAKRADPSKPDPNREAKRFKALFGAVPVPKERISEAMATIKKWDAEYKKNRGPALAQLARFGEIGDQLNAELRALLATDADRLAFDAHAAQFRPARAQGIEDVIDMEYGNAFQRTPLDPAKKAQARAIIRSAINEEMAMWRSSPDKYDPAPIIARRDAELRKIVPDKDKALYDSVARMVAKHRNKSA